MYLGMRKTEKQNSSETSISLKVLQKSIFQSWLSRKTEDGFRCNKNIPLFDDILNSDISIAF